MGEHAAFRSAADVPAAVRAAVAAFEPPRGFDDLPTPAKNSAQRSLLYFYGRRVRRERPPGGGARGAETKWFCLASAACRANGTAISTAANTSGCTRHLQVFHGLVSPKTLQMAKKAAGTPVGAATPNASAATSCDAREAPPVLARDSGDAQRAARMDWTRVMAVRHLLPLAALVNDEQVARLTNRPVDPDGQSEDAVLRHIVEYYAATRGRLKGLIQREIARATLPILHVGLLTCGVPGSPSTCARVEASTALTLVVSFVSSTFKRQQFALGVTHTSSLDLEPHAAVPDVLWWIASVLGEFGITSASVRCLVLDRTSPLSDQLADALSRDDEAAVNHGLGGLSVEFSIESVAVSALSAACTRGSCLSQLVAKLREIAASPGVNRMAVDVETLEDLAACLGGRGSGKDVSLAKRCDPSTWIAVGRALQWVVHNWQSIGETATTSAEIHQSTTSETLHLTRADLQQSLAILQSVIDILHSGLGANRSRGDCSEAVVGAFAVRLSALNELEPLELARNSMDADQSDDGLVESGNDVENRYAGVVRPADVTGFSRKLRHELASHWDVVVQDGVHRADSACLATFLHPCFRHLEFMDSARRAAILEQIKALGRTVVVSQRRQLESPPSVLNDSRSYDEKASRVWKKRKTAMEMAKHERLARQTESLVRLGLLKTPKSFPPPSEQPSSSLTNDPSSCSTNAPLMPTCSSPTVLVANELERYMQNESIAFQAVAFDETLTYWDRKAFEYPILSTVAAAVSGAPRSLRAICSASSYAGRGGCCVRCSLRKCRFRELTPSQSLGNAGYTSRRLEEALHFLHLNETLMPAAPSVPPLTSKSIVEVLESLGGNSRFSDTADL